MPIFARSLLVFGALALGATINTAHAADWPEKVLWNFVPPDSTNSQFGWRPQMGVTVANGDLYGSAAAGGKNGGGVVYRYDSGKMAALYSFTDQDTSGCGYNPSARLVRNSSTGALYGTTYQGGQNNGGVLFEVRKNSSGKWVCNVLWAFKKNPTDVDKRGYASFGGLVPDGTAPNTFYGTTQFSQRTNPPNGVKKDTGGVVFKLSKTGSTWKYDVLKEFTPGAASNGLVPTGPLTLVGTTLYGATFFGGANDGGVIYKMETDGTGFTVLHRFNGDITSEAAKRGYQPTQGPLLVMGGVIYGETTSGGTTSTDLSDPSAGDLSTGGVVYRLSPSGNYKLLYSFDNQDTPDNGYGPIGGVTLGPDGFLYGNTQFGGVGAGGTVFRLKGANKNVFELIFDFPDVSLGFRPTGPLFVNGSGTIIGTTLLGGAENGGTIFRLTPP